MKLSILITTIPESANFLKRITNILQPQVSRYPEVEILINDTGRDMPTGTKRNQMIQDCKGQYYCFVDVDDIVPAYYVDELMKSINQNPDVITFIGYMTTNGGSMTDFVIKLGERYEYRLGKYYRFPNHLCCFKKSLVSHIKFSDVWEQEDYIWAKKVNDMGLLKSEVHIPVNMYHYDFITTKAPYRHGTAKVL